MILFESRKSFRSVDSNLNLHGDNIKKPLKEWFFNLYQFIWDCVQYCFAPPAGIMSESEFVIL